MLFVSAQSYGESKRLDYNNAYIAYLAQNSKEIDDLDAEAYCDLFYKKDYNKLRNDEFEWPQKLIEMKNELKTVMSNYNVEISSYYISTGGKFGEYDFNNNGFPGEYLDGATFSLERDMWSGVMYSSDVSKRLKNKVLILINGNDFNFLDYEKNKAKELISSRKDSLGSIDRRVLLVPEFKLIPNQSKEYLQEIKNIEKKYKGFDEADILLGKILEVEVYIDAEKPRKMGKLRKLEAAPPTAKE
jgi:hypothetical protein